MRKITFNLLSGVIVVASIINPMSIMAEDIDSKVHLKVHGGMSFSTISGENGVFGPSAGGRFDIRVSSQPVYVGAGIEYMNRGYKHNSNHAFVIPFLGSYHILIGKELFLEPFAGTTLSYGFNWKNWDCGLRLGCNIRASRWDFQVGYDLGVRHYSFKNADGRDHSIFIGVGYNFKIDIN